MTISCITQENLGCAVVSSNSKCLFLVYALSPSESAVALFMSFLSLAKESHMSKPDVSGLRE